MRRVGNLHTSAGNTDRPITEGKKMNIFDIQNMPRIEGLATRGVAGVAEEEYQGTTMLQFWDGNEWVGVRMAVRPDDGEIIPAAEADWLTFGDLSDFSAQ